VRTSYIFRQVFLANLESRGIRLLSESADRRTAGSNDSYGPNISADGRFVTFRSHAANLGAPSGEFGQVYQRNITPVATVDRIGGADRYEVSAGISRDAFPAKAPVVYVASGAGFADALSGSAVAGIRRGPVLLVQKDAVPAVVAEELGRLEPQEIVVLGGVNSVSNDVERSLAEYAPNVSRVGGANRYEVSVNLAGTVDWPKVVGAGTGPIGFMASGEVFPDALSGSAVAGRMGPIVLASKNSLSAGGEAALKESGAKSIAMLGGTNTLSDLVAEQAGKLAPLTRFGGADRFAVSAGVANRFFSPGVRTVYVASGEVFPDALSGSAAAALNEAPVLLVTKGEIPASVAAELERLDPVRIVVLGGENTVSAAVQQKLEQYVVAPK
jgi:putative cell wall-binding protein